MNRKGMPLNEIIAAFAGVFGGLVGLWSIVYAFPLMPNIPGLVFAIGFPMVLSIAAYAGVKLVRELVRSLTKEKQETS